mgnify:CR=1 FL=1
MGSMGTNNIHSLKHSEGDKNLGIFFSGVIECRNLGGNETR